MKRRLGIPSLVLWLTVLWVALWGDVSPGNIVGGLAVAIGVVAVARPVGVTGLESTAFRPFAATHYALYFLKELVKSNLFVAWEIVTPHTNTNRAIISVPMHTMSASVVTLVANTVTLTPGTLTIDVHEDDPDENGQTARTLFIHVLHFVDIDTVRRDVLRLERLAVKAFGPRDDLAAVEAELAALEQR